MGFCALAARASVMLGTVIEIAGPRRFCTSRRAAWPRPAGPRDGSTARCIRLKEDIGACSVA
eukprot:6268375-Prymnesium_polylepis.1